MDADVKQIIVSVGHLEEKINSTLADVTSGRLAPTVFTDLEKLPQATVKTPLHWLQDSNVGNTGGASAVPHGSFSWVSPNAVTINPAGAFDNYFFFTIFPLPDRMPSNFIIAFENFAVVPESAKLCQALEFQVEVRDGINIYNMAWQADQSSKSMRLFDHLGNSKGIPEPWIAQKDIPFPDLGKPLRIVAEFNIDRIMHTCTHDSLWINGTRFEVGVTQTATPASTGVEISAAFQLDSNASGSSYTAEISGMKVAWL